MTQLRLPVGPPQRTCVGCRQRSEVRILLRVVALEGVLMPDSARRLPGRGAYLHRDPRCLALAERRRVWSRALRAPGPFDAFRLRAALEPADATSTGQ